MDDIKTKGDMLNYLTKMVTEYAPKCKSSVYRNTHMNEVNPMIDNISQEYIDTVLVDFVNYVGSMQVLIGYYIQKL